MGGQLWAKIALNMADNPKIIGLSDSAFRAFIEAILYSRQQLTDGFLDRRVVAKRWGLDVAAELCTNDPHNPSWVEVEGGFQVHGFCEYQTTSGDIATMKENKSRGGKASAEAKRQRKLNTESTETQQTVNTTSTDAQPESESESETEVHTEVVISRPKRMTTLKADWKPSPAGYDYARERAPGLNVAVAIENFMDYNLRNARTNADWDAAWRTWVRKAVEFDPSLATPPPPPKRQFGIGGDNV